MNDKDLQVVLQAMLDIDESGKNIKAQLDSLKQKLPDLELDIDANFNLDALLKQFTKLKKTFSETIIDDKSIRTTTKLNDSLGKTIQIVKTIDKLTGKDSYKITPTIDLDKQNKSLEKQAELYKEIRNTLDNIPSVFKDTQTVDDFYNNLNLLDTTDSLDDFKKLKKEVDIYYKESIRLEKEYQQIKENTLKEEQDKVDFIYDKRKQLLDLERQISTLSATKGVNTGNYTPEIENLRSILGGLSTTGESLYDNQRNEINQVIDSLKQKLALEKDSLNIQKLQEEAQIKINNARQNLNDIIAKNGKYDEGQYEKLNNSLNTLEGNLKSGAISSQDFNLQMKKLSPEMKQFETEARKASASTSTLSSRFKRFLSFYSFYDVLQAGKRLIRDVATEIKALDDSILEVNKILNLSTKEMDKFVDKAYLMGDAISRTGIDMINATGTLVKAGFSDLDDAMDYASLALSMKNVGDNMNDVERNANILISTMKGYGDESVQFAEKTLNVLNEVSNTSAITFEALSESFTRTSAVYAQAGVSIERLAGLATGANEIIQNIEKSSSGLLIISQRIRGVSDSFEEDPENLSKLDSALKRIANVDIQDATGQLRDTYSILNDIAKVYPTLTQNERAYLSELISGKRQKAVFEALMANWKKVEEATNSAMNSQNSYMKEQEAYFNSISGHLAKLESAWQSLATSSMDSGFAKNLIDILTLIIKITEKSGGLQTVLVGLISSFTSFGIITKSGALKKLATDFTFLTKTAGEGAAAVTTLSLAGKLLIGFGIVAGVMAIGAGINYIATRAERAEKKVKTLSDELKTLNQTTDDITKLANAFEKLSSTKNKTPEQIQELIDTQNQLKELLPNLKGFYNEKGNFIVETDKEKSNLQDLIDLQEESLELKREDLKLASQKVTDFSLKEYEKESKRLKQLIKLQELNQKYDRDGLSRQEQQQRINLNNMLDIPIGENIGSEIENVRDSIDKSLTDISEKFISTIADTKEWGKLSDEEADAVRKAFSELDETSLIKYVDGVKDDTIAIQELIDLILKSDAGKNYLQENLNAVANAADQAAEAITTLEESITSLSNTRSNIEKLQSVLDNLNSGNFSASDMEELLGISEEFIPYLNNEVALREKLTQSISDYKDEYTNGYQAILDTSNEFYEQRIKGDENLYNGLRSNVSDFFNDLGVDYTDDFENYKNLEEAKAELTNKLISELAGSWSKYFDAFTGQIDPRVGWGGGALGSNGSAVSQVVDAYSKIKSAQAELDKIFADSYTPSLFTFDTNKSSTTSGSSIEESAEDLAQAQADAIISAYEKANREIERKLTQLDLSQRLTTENSAEYVAIEKEKYNAIIAQETLLQQKIAELQAQGTEVATEEAENLIDTYYNLMNERYSIIENLQSITVTNLESQKEAIESIHEYTMDMIKAELEAKKESYQEEMDDIEKIFNAKKQALQDEKNERDYTNKISDYNTNIADLENQLALIKNDETAIAKRKALEEELAQAKEDLADYQYDQSIERQENALDTELELQKEALQEEIDELDDTLNNEVKMRELADKRIQKSGEKLYSQLIDYAEEYGEVTRDEISDAWENATTSINGYTTAQEDLLGTLKLVTAELAKIDSGNLSTSGYSTASFNEKLAQMKANSASWTSASTDERTRLAEENQKLGKELGLTYDPQTGRWFYDKEKKYPVYHDGGIVGGSAYATKSTEELAKLLKGEIVLTEPMAQKAVDMITNNNNNSQVVSPTIIFNIEGEASQSTIDLIKQNAKEVADIVASEFNKVRANTGFKKPVKAF